jgi:hypothetical protein
VRRLDWRASPRPPAARSSPPLAPDDRDYEAAIQRVIDGGVSLAAVDLGSAYAIEIDTAADLRAAEAAVRAGPAFAPRGLPLAV